MKTAIEIATHPVNDLPVLIWQQRVMGIPQIIDQQIHPHGNRQGLSVGWTVVGWLSYIMSQADHRMSYVEGWAEQHLMTLQGLIPEPVRVSDFSDDRLGDVLRYLSNDASWSAIECELGQQVMQVYELKADRIHVDSTSVALYHDGSGNPLVEYGLSKDHRPDLAQFKVMMSSLSPFGMPLATLVVAGNRADDRLYFPVIEQSRQVLQRRGLLYIGDSKMEALAIRAALAQGGDFYLTPLSQKGGQEQLLSDLLESVWAGEQPLSEIYDLDADAPDRRLLAKAFERVRSQSTRIKGETVTWSERMLVVYSPSLAESATQGLSQRLHSAQQALLALTPPVGRGRRQWQELPPLQQAVAAILKHHRVAGLLDVTYVRHECQQTIRRYKQQPARTETKVRYQLQVTPNPHAIALCQRRFGWRIFVTNAPSTQLSLAEAVRAYRHSPLHEHNFSRLKNRPLGLRPLFVHRPDHMTGLVRLLSLALRLLTLLEFIVRRQLLASKQVLSSLYEGNPNRTTQRPTTERLLRAFQPITLSIVSLPSQSIAHLTPLTSLQSQILALLGLPDSIYADLPDLVHSIPP